MIVRPFLTFRQTQRALVRALRVTVVLVLALVAAAAVAAAPASAATSEDYFFLSSFGPDYAPGDFFGEFGAGPNGIATDSAGNIYVTIPRGFVKYYSTGTVACVYTGDNGYTAGNSYGLDVDSSGNVYYADRINHCIAKLHPYSYGVNGNVYNLVSLTGKNGADWLEVPGGGGDANIGTGDGEFNFPNDVAVDGHYLYVTDLLNHRIQKFDTATGDNTLAFVAKWGKNGGDGTSGSGSGEFNKPRGIAADGSGHLFVTEEINRRVQELTTAGVFVGTFGATSAADPLYLLDPTGVDVDAQGGVYVTDLGDSTSWVGKFRQSLGTWSRVTRLGSFGTGNAQFTYPWSSVVDPDGCLWVTDTQNWKLKKFARDTTPPTVTPAGWPTGWTRTVGHPEFTATDPTVDDQYTSGGVSVGYSRTGGAPWTPYYEPFASLDFDEGDSALTYYAEDAVGNESTPATVHLYYDVTVPATAPSGVPDAWSKTDVAVTLTPGDDGFSPIASTEYRLQGAPAWSIYSGPFAVSAEGVSVYEYRSTDRAGNVETPKTLTVSVDKTAPVTAASWPGGWSKTDVAIVLSPGADGRSPVVSTEHRLQGAATWTEYAGPIAVTAEGATTCEFRSTDQAGNVESIQTVTVNIDKTLPVPKALANRSVKRLRTVKLPYRIDDPPCSHAKIVIKIYKGRALRKTLKVGTQSANTALAYRFKCKLPKGRYSWKVYATDLAGNKQLKPSVRTLTVR